MTFNRHLDVDGIFNLRDVGHYATADGRTVQPGRLFRCGALHDLPALTHLEIRTVLDLRTDAEIERDAIACGPLREADGVRRTSLSLIPQNVDGLGVTA
ncbi:MAG TPA: tyrosine-protein phosphatase, partial [Dehalococcoidia bacterium]|nr:tyrosine-protein phosphatase [Dehalococcoidia bacterium]